MSAYIVAAARSVIAPKGGLHANTPLHALAAPALKAAWPEAGWLVKHAALRKKAFPKEPDLIILGNALAAGGNPARVCSLAAFSESVPALTIDTQCCAGLDAIGMASNTINAGNARAVIAGGVESFSQAPLRGRTTKQGVEFYEQAQFTPWPERDPNVLLAAQAFAQAHKISRAEQEAYAIESHQKALRHAAAARVSVDPYTRTLTQKACARFAPLVRNNAYAITAATVAPQADGAAALLVVDKFFARNFPFSAQIIAHVQCGCDPSQPAMGGVIAAKKLLKQLSKKERERIRCVEIMESFAAQAIHTRCELGIDPKMVNANGGLLAIGHPIGASGAVLVGNLFYRLMHEPAGSLGLAVIPAAGGLGSALLIRK
jgi:acetyl-CoA C-acetyltransferase